METAPTSSTPSPCCFICHKLQTELPLALKRCAKCQGTLYCSRQCQKNDWKNHKRICTSQASSSQGFASSVPQQSTGRHNPGFQATNQLLGLSNDDYLHVFPEKEALVQIIDCFRMRMDDEYKFGGNYMGIYAEQDPFPDFKEFLDLAESRSGILPPWWNAEKRQKCEVLAMYDGWSNITHCVEKDDIQEHYSDGIMPMKLRILGEKIYGRGFM